MKPQVRSGILSGSGAAETARTLLDSCLIGTKMDHRTCATCGKPLDPRAKGDYCVPHRVRPRKMPSGYLRVWSPGHPLGSKDGYVLEHRKVLHDAGIEVPTGYHVHHINHDKTDNRLENLAVVEESKHHAAHVAEAGCVTNQYGTFPLRAAVCGVPDCDLSPHSLDLCSKHYSRLQRHGTTVDLIADVRRSPLTPRQLQDIVELGRSDRTSSEIAKELGISPPRVMKALREHGLARSAGRPRTKP